MLTEEEKKCEEFFEKTTKRDNEGRYIVRLPFCKDDPTCKYGNLKDIAAKSLFRLERRLNRDSDLKVQYSNGMDTLLAQNHMERVPAADRNKNTTVYLPHHPVIRNDKTTTKVRIVYNASQKGHNGVALNDELLCGPKLQADLRHLILLWRRHPICLSADIEKMYLQIKIAEEDTDFLRLLWRDKNGVLEHYRMTRVTFGTASAPYLAVKALRQLAIDEGGHYPLASVRILNDYYMDDLMTGCETVEEALEIYTEMNILLKKGGFALQKWISNSIEFLDRAGESQGKGDKDVAIGAEKETDGMRKVLGLNWESVTDKFRYTVNLPDILLPVTKRRAISDISRLFDPLGFLAPVIITAKILIQKMWIAGIDWDQELPSNLLQEWIVYRKELNQVTGFNINRWIESRRDDESVELQGFCDASSEAYGAVVYVRVVDRHGKVHVNLVSSKTKVAPVKQISIPRLELCSAVLLTKLLDEVSNVLKIPKSQVFAWTDSTIVLAWLSSHPRKWNTFVANRVSEIISLLSRKHWYHVRTGENPADLASRGMKPSDFIENQLWKKGPKWLREDKITYSPLKEESKIVELYETKEEMKVKCCSNITIEEDSLFAKYSTMKRQLRVIAWCRRFFKLVHIKPKPAYPKWLSHTELQEARSLCIKHSQKHYFKEEIEALKNMKGIARTSKLRSFTPFLDVNNILRIGGRLQNSSMSDAAKHPILISQHSHLARLLIGEAHERTLHGGAQLMLAHLRAKYWIIDAKKLVKSYIRECLVCVRHSARVVNPIMGQLPSARVTPSRPFKNSGVDFAGPIAVRSSKGRGHHATKGYICLFICMCTRAIHLEMVSDLTSDAFIAAFKRFVARRGQCAELWSDNGTNFIGAERELQSLFISERSSVAVDIQEWLASNGTNFHRIPPYSPHFGGLWEAGVKSTKHHLRRIIGTSTLTFEEMSTLLSQIEACLNSRPITVVDSDCNEPYPLTPGHFLVGEPLLIVPDRSYKDSKITSLKRWQLTQRMVQDFWRRWSQEYLTRFLQRQKWQQSTSEPNVGDLVFIMENDLPPSRWLFGVIVEKHPGLDGVTRVVSIRCQGSIIKRPICKICIIPKKEGEL